MRKKIQKTEEEKQDAEISSYLSKWRQRLGLGHWRLTVVMCDRACQPDSISSTETAARITSDCKYLQARIEIFPRFWEDSQPDREHSLVHEFVHIVLSEYDSHIENLRSGVLITSDQALVTRERAAQMLASALLDVQ